MNVEAAKYIGAGLATIHDDALERQALDLGIVGHAVLQRPRLADIEHIAARIEHPVNARLGLQGGKNLADRGDAQLDVRPAALHRKGRLILVEALGEQPMQRLVEDLRQCRMRVATRLRVKRYGPCTEDEEAGRQLREVLEDIDGVTVELEAA